MPVRMVKDEEPDNQDGGGRRPSGRGGGLPNWAIMGFVFLLFRKPKLALTLGLIALVLWLVFGGGLESCAGGLTGETSTSREHGLGARLDRAEFDRAQVFEPLAPGELPQQVSLAQYAPPAGDQGTQGSCTAWATAYCARTIQESAAHGIAPQQAAFSPAFLYNQLVRGQCDGTSIRQALELVRQRGLVPEQAFPYTDQDCSRQPNGELFAQAERYRIAGYNRLTLNHDNYAVDLNAVKQNLAQGAPVVIGMLVGGSFYQMQGEQLWQPTQRDYSAMRSQRGGHIVNDGTEAGFGGHAMTIIGYDDSKFGGALHIMNSWGQRWGDQGTFWMRYSDFAAFTNELGAEVYGLYPMKARAPGTAAFEASVGLIENSSSSPISLIGTSGATVQTAQVQPKGTKFKMEVSNSVECYTYVLGQESDGSSYVLFPYTEKHSPYCGITGRRLFPKDYSMQLDAVGSRDVMAVLLTKQEIDVKALNAAVNQRRGGSYEARLRAVIGEALPTELRLQPGDRVSFSLPTSSPAQAVLVVIEIPKQ